MEPLLPFRDGESKRAGRPSSRDGARDVCSKRLRAPADAADPRESTDRPSGLDRLDGDRRRERLELV